MPGFFESIAKLPEHKKSLPEVTIDGKQYQVSTKLFNEIRNNGEAEYHIVKGEICRRPQQQARSKYSMLEKGDKGLGLLQGNMFWPTDVVDGGYTWTR